MIHHSESDNSDAYEDIEGKIPIRNLPRRNQGVLQNKLRRPRMNTPHSPGLVENEMESENTFEFSYHAGRHEKIWMSASLIPFHEQGWIEDVLRLVKGGKEATVYLCKGESDSDYHFMAAKVYRPRQFRNLKDDHLYQEGRTMLDGSGSQVIKDRELRAVQKKTDYGWKVQHTSWIEYEYQSLRLLHDAGADVPVPFSRGNNAILMQYIGDELTPAPTLNTIELSNREAHLLFQRILHNVELMLANNRIHGDLSAFNILYWKGEITIIDFPQVIEPEKNTNAYRIFERDLTRIGDYFKHYDVNSDPQKIAGRLWKSYHHRLSPLIDPLFLNEENPSDRQAWEKQQHRIIKENK